MFVAGVVLFVAASAACTLAPDMGSLIVMRAVQRCGTALIMPLAVTLLSVAFRPEQRARALGAFSGVAGLAVLAGPALGGASAGGLAVDLLAGRPDRSDRRAAGTASSVRARRLNLLYFHDRYADEQRLQIGHQHRSGPAPALLRLDSHRRSARIDLPKRAQSRYDTDALCVDSVCNINCVSIELSLLAASCMR
jgi:hypothetical protein